ncbi:hypothetical protein ACIQXD_14260 [Streptomyces uncialis]|uniref:hypothetical protein n=1 Tax=Streptomyces uncialis TaxID=1048205 RepID=UPI0038261418
MIHTTADGGTVEVRRVGITFDMHVRDPAGRTVATVTMSADDAYALLLDLEDLEP